MNTDPEESRFIKSHGGKRPGSGRPAGSPNKLTRPLKEAAAMESEACLQTLVYLRDHGESEQVRLAATTAILDRGYGRPRQEVGIEDRSGFTVILNKPGGHAVIMSGPPNVPALIDHQPDDDEGLPSKGNV